MFEFQKQIAIRTNWRQLQKQKRYLMKLADEAQSAHGMNMLGGVIHFLDEIQDLAVDHCGIPDEEVFDK